MSTQDSGAEDWERSDARPQGPSLRRSNYVSTYKFYKRFQLQVLLILVAFIVVLLAYQAYFAKDVLKEVLTLVLPLFTFVLGMGSKSD